MELTWPIRLRILAAAAVGVLLIGISCWPIARPAEHFGIVWLQNLVGTELMEIISISFFCGFVGYCISWPYGREIGILAVPFGLAVLAVRSGSIANLMQLNADVQSRQLIFQRLRFEPFFWLLLVLVGFAGVFAAQRLFGKSAQKPVDEKEQKKEDEKTTDKAKVPNLYLNFALAVVSSIIIAGLGIIILAQNVRFSDGKFGSVIAQLAIGQIVFAVIVSFGLAGFIVKKVLNVSYILPIIAAPFVTTIGLIIYTNSESLDYMAGLWPANFFSNSIVSVLPIQMVCFGTLGAIWGYWLAVRYNYWRHHET